LPLLGAAASGKSALALRLAEKQPLEIVSSIRRRSTGHGHRHGKSPARPSARACRIT